MRKLNQASEDGEDGDAQDQSWKKLELVTLIIPTFNRTKFLARLLNYYAMKKTHIHFLVLDSSGLHAREANKINSAVLGDSVRYVSFPETMPVAIKLLEGLKLVETPFCAFCADDDLVFVDGLKTALSFLEDHPDYVCVDGIYLNFHQVESNVHLKVEYATKGITADDPGARVFKLYQKYESLFYGVFQTQHALNIFSGVCQNTSLHYQELFQATSALLIGKSHRLPLFYAARQHCNPADLHRDKWQTYYWFAEDPKEFIEYYLVYRDILWDFYQKHILDKKYSKESFFQVMDIAHAMYFGTGCPPAYFHSVLNHEWPNEAFQKANLFQHDICNELKSPRRVWWETYIDKFSTWFPKQIASVYSIRDTRSLNNEILTKTRTQLNCKLSPELRWLASVDIFRHAYYELCRYMCFI
jgi:glycosyltransferase domain-containing protein